jgi:SAM-dependent methyltransferase
MSGQPWNASYRDGPAPWDVGRPQPAVVELAFEGAFGGVVLDSGCGTGENALHIASLGLAVLGFDIAETAVALAREKAEQRGIEAEFIVADARRLEGMGRTFDTVLDCALFHAFDREERRAYTASLAHVTKVGGILHLLCFSDAAPGTGPHPVAIDELHAAFVWSGKWRIDVVAPARLLTRFHDECGAPAWQAAITRM